MTSKPILRSQEAPDELARGAYVIAYAAQRDPQVILIGTGSEVQLCIRAYEQLISEGFAVRGVNMPSWELFERQDQGYRESVLPRHIHARVTVEQGRVVDCMSLPGRGDSPSMRVRGLPGLAGQSLKQGG